MKIRNFTHYRRVDTFFDWLAITITEHFLPRRLVYWSFIRVAVNATTGKYSSQVVPELTAMTALKRWEKQ